MGDDDAVQPDPTTIGVGSSPGADGSSGSGGGAGTVGSAGSDGSRGRSDLAAEVADLRHRVLRLERILLSVYCLCVATLLVLGSFFPIFTETSAESDDLPWSVTAILGTAVGALFGGEWPYSDSPGLLIAYTAGFIGLAIIIAILVIYVLPTVAAGQMVSGRRRVAQIVAVLGLVGSLVPVLLSLMSLAAAGSEDSDAGWGGVVLFVGMIGAVIPVFASGRAKVERSGPW